MSNGISLSILPGFSGHAWLPDLNIMAYTAVAMQWRINNGVVQPISQEWISKHIPVATNMHTTIEEAVCSVGQPQGYIMRISCRRQAEVIQNHENERVHSI
jgi:hypothetical protein